MDKPTTAISLRDLSEKDVAWLQESLNALGFSAGEKDGLVGPRTLDAWADFKESVSLNSPDSIELIGPSSFDALTKAIAHSREKAKEHDFSTKAGTIAAIRFECDRQGLTLPPQQAYCIATVQHETANTFKPIAEYGKGAGLPYGKPDSITGQIYYGRGYVQLTWKSNYAKYGQILGIDLVNHPELACLPNVALFVLVHGFRTGAFTGKKLSDYVNNQKTDFFNARRCINGLDKAQKIADRAQAIRLELFANGR